MVYRVLILPSIQLTTYILPGDGAAARARFLRLLYSPGETWIADYGFTEADLVREIESADSAGVAVHLLLDRSQAKGATERQVLAGIKLAHGDLTLSTAGPDSASPGEILHTKALICRATDGGEDWCWLGSVNFSKSGWLESNTATLFRSTAFANAFIDWFNRTRTWALTHVAQS